MMSDTLMFRCILTAALVAAVAVAGAYGQKGFKEDVFETSAGTLKVTFIGHGSLMFSLDGKVIHIDPTMMVYPEYASLPKADLILVTHEHGDYFDAKAIEAIRTPGTKIVANAAAAQSVPGAVVLNNGDAQTVAGVPVEAVAAYNPEKPFHPKGNGNGYILTFGNTRVYVAGDTEFIPEMRAIKSVDVAFLPMNQPYTMTPEQAADAAKAFRPKVVYPYHYQFGDTDTAKFVDLLKDEKGIEVRIRY